MITFLTVHLSAFVFKLRLLIYPTRYAFIGNGSKMHELTEFHVNSFSSRVNFARIVIVHESKKKTEKIKLFIKLQKEKDKLPPKSKG